MSFFKKLFGLSEPESAQAPKLFPASRWAGHLAELIASEIARSGVDRLKNFAACISRSNNRPFLCLGEDGMLPEMTDDPDVLVFCYLKDVATFDANTKLMRRLIELETSRAQMLAEATGDKSLLEGLGKQSAHFPMIAQLAFSVAHELEERVAKLQ